MTTEEIDYLVADIMIEDGPDGHCDGHEIITAFIVELLNGKGKDWADEYRKSKAIQII